MNNLFLTGKIGVGKSTIINKILNKINYPTGGYITEKIEDRSTKTFTIKSLDDDRIKYTIAKVNKDTFEKEIFIDNFKYNIPLMLDKDLKDRDLIVLDELGFMENDIDPFTAKIYEILDSDKIVFGVLKDYNCEFLNNIRQRDDVIIIEITEDNRDNIEQKIMNILLEIKVKKEPHNYMPNEKSNIHKKNNEEDIEMIVLKTVNNNIELNFIKNILDGNKIPYIIQDQGSGGYMRIYSGFSIYGTDILVEKSRYNEAKEILENFPL